MSDRRKWTAERVLASRPVRLPQWLPSRPDLPGLALAAAIGGAALAFARALPPSPWVSDILIALVLGALVMNTPLRRVVGIAVPGPEREPDRYAAGLRFTGKWVLRGGIILMGLKVQTSFFGRVELLLIGGVASAALPSAFFVAHALAALLGVRRPMGDLLAGGTMICGASAVNAIAPVAGARREEQGLAIGVVFLFSLVALVAFRPIAAAVGLSPGFAGLWSGLAVNDLSSAIAVGAQMGGDGAVMAAASKSARILLLAPTLVILSLLRRQPELVTTGPASNRRGASTGLGKSIADQLPRFLLGYIGLAVLRAAGDRALGPSPAWSGILAADKLAVDFLMVTVSAGIGLHLDLRNVLAAGARSVAVGGGASACMAALTLAMITAVARGAGALAALVGVGGLLVTFLLYRWSTRAEAAILQLRRRFASGAPLSLAETTGLLDAAERDASLDDGLLRRALGQLFPSIGELIPVRESPLPHGDGCRWATYWVGASGWALVAVCREPGSATPIHAHPHRLLRKTIEGSIEELCFDEGGKGELVLTDRRVPGHNEIVETDGLGALHVVRALGARPAIDLQLRGPELGKPGRLLRPRESVDFAELRVGARLTAEEAIDERPGQGGEGAGGGMRPHGS